MTTENQILVGPTRVSGVSDVLERTESKLLDLEIDQVLDLYIFLGHEGTILKDSLETISDRFFQNCTNGHQCI